MSTETTTQTGFVSRAATLLYGLICYSIFFLTFLYALGFVGNLVVPKSIDGEPVMATLPALLINLLLLGVFAIQHSVMARPGFKKIWTRIVPVAVERSTYVLFSSAALIALFRFWEPLGGVIWSVSSPLATWVLLVGFAFGWSLVLISTFLINHFDLFGLRQVWLYFRNKPYTPVNFVTPLPYRIVRHPLYLGWLFGFWCAPTMTVTHLVFAVMTTAYILIAIQFEERDLTKALAGYAEYKRRVPMIIPRFGNRARNKAAV
jgi:protein-S-isoprenylcysteine O-methyltransferase Ste14